MASSRPVPGAVGWLVAGLLLLPASLTPPAAAAPPARMVSCTAIESIGPLRIDDPASRAVQVLGRPSQQTPRQADVVRGGITQQWIWVQQGLTLEVTSDGKAAPRIASISIQAPCRWCTAGGLGVGSTATQARAIYGPQLDLSSSGADRLVVGSLYDGLVLTLAKGRVVRIFLGAAAE